MPNGTDRPRATRRPAGFPAPWSHEAEPLSYEAAIARRNPRLAALIAGDDRGDHR